MAVLILPVTSNGTMTVPIQIRKLYSIKDKVVIDFDKISGKVEFVKNYPNMKEFTKTIQPKKPKVPESMWSQVIEEKAINRFKKSL